MSRGVRTYDDLLRGVAFVLVVSSFHTAFPLVQPKGHVDNCPRLPILRHNQTRRRRPPSFLARCSRSWWRGRGSVHNEEYASSALAARACPPDDQHKQGGKHGFNTRQAIRTQVRGGWGVAAAVATRTDAIKRNVPTATKTSNDDDHEDDDDPHDDGMGPSPARRPKDTWERRHGTGHDNNDAQWRGLLECLSSAVDSAAANMSKEEDLDLIDGNHDEFPASERRTDPSPSPT